MAVSDPSQEELEALLERFDQQLNSLQPEDFLDRLRSWGHALLRFDTHLSHRSAIKRVLGTIHQFDAEPSPDQREPQGAHYRELHQVINEALDALRRPRENVIREPGRPVTQRFQTRDALPEELLPSIVVPPGTVTPPSLTDERLYRVWFGTDRNAIHTDAKFEASGTWSETLTYGSCLVHVPETHRFGSVGSSWITRKINELLRNEEDDRLKITRIETQDPDTFLEAIGAALAPWPTRRTALVFVHGYNTTFRDAAVRAAQIGVDLRIDGITAFFSWASKGQLLAYPHDEASIDLSENHFIEFMLRLSQAPGLEEINIIAHSMGNRLLCRTVPRLMELQRSGELKVPVGHMILAAADLTTDLFRQYSRVYTVLSQRRVTNYSYKADLALRSSLGLHGVGRVGLEPPLFVHDGVDTVSASRLRLNIDLLGHGYFAAAQPLLYDIAELIHDHKPPAQRIRLRPGPAEHGLHWVFVP